MSERASRAASRSIRIALQAIVAAAVLAATVVGLAVTTPLQEVSFRWMGLTGVALPVTVMLAATATLAAVCYSVGAPRGARGARIAVLVGSLAVWSLVTVLAWPTLAGMASPRDPGDGVELDLVVQNLWYRNPDPSATAAAVISLDADVLVLVEYTSQHAEALRLAGASTAYPYRWEAPAELGSGLAVLSRVPLGPATPIPTRGGGATMELRPPGGLATLDVVHPIAPRNRWGLANWTKDYAVLRSTLDGVPANTIVAGDFNATGAHRRYRELLEVAQLGDAQDLSGSGFGATWPSAQWRWIPPLMRLDRVLVGDAIGVDGVEVLDAMGADHRGVLARLRLPADGS